MLKRVGAFSELPLKEKESEILRDAQWKCWNVIGLDARGNEEGISIPRYDEYTSHSIVNEEVNGRTLQNNQLPCKYKCVFRMY